jgi:hypothetical protein
MYLSIYEAIENRYLLQFQYCGYFRIIEPHVYGHDARFGDVLRGYQVEGADEQGKHRGWKWFRTGKIQELQILSTHFAHPRQGWQQTVDRLERLYCHLDGVVIPHTGTRTLPADSVVDC